MPRFSLSCSYHQENLVPEALRERVTGIAQAIQNAHISFSHIAVRGVSGLIVGGPLSVRAGIPLIVVRKPNEQAHGRCVEGVGFVEHYIIVDDLIDTGATIQEILHALAPARCVGIFLYRPCAHSCFSQVCLEDEPIPIYSV